MKFLLCSAIIAIFSITASAQIKKGSILLGGQISYVNSRTEFNTPQPDQKIKFAFLNISTGLAVKENSVLGIYSAYGKSDFSSNFNGSVYSNSTTNSYRVGFFYRQYRQLAKDLYLFGELGAGYTGYKQTDTEVATNNVTMQRGSGAELYLTPGISYRIYKKLQVELLIPQIAGIRYSTAKTTSLTTNIKEDRFSFDTNLNSSLINNLGLGFRFIF